MLVLYKLCVSLEVDKEVVVEVDEGEEVEEKDVDAEGCFVGGAKMRLLNALPSNAAKHAKSSILATIAGTAGLGVCQQVRG